MVSACLMFREIEAAGYAELAPKRFSRVTDNGVKPAFIRLKDECVTASSSEEFGSRVILTSRRLSPRLKDEDVDSRFIRPAKARAYNVSLQEMIRLKDRGTL